MENPFFQKNKFIIYSSLVILVYFIFLYSVYFYDLGKLASEELVVEKSNYKLLYLVNQDTPLTLSQSLEAGTPYLGSFQIPPNTNRIDVIERCVNDSDFNFYPLPEVNFSNEINYNSLNEVNSSKKINVYETKASLLYVYDFNTKKATQLNCSGQHRFENNPYGFVSPDTLIILDDYSLYENEYAKNDRTFFWFGDVRRPKNNKDPLSLNSFDTIVVNGQKIPSNSVKLNPFAPLQEKDFFYGVTVLGWVK